MEGQQTISDNQPIHLSNVETLCKYIYVRTVYPPRLYVCIYNYIYMYIYIYLLYVYTCIISQIVLLLQSVVKKRGVRCTVRCGHAALAQ